MSSKALFQRPLCHRAFPSRQRSRLQQSHRCHSVTERAPAGSQDVTISVLARFDADGDGRLTIAEAQEAFATLQALQAPSNGHHATLTAASNGAQPEASTSAPATAASAPTPTRPVTWELQVLNGIRAACARGQGLAPALLDHLSSKLRNRGGAHASASDLVWSFCGMFCAVTALGLMSLHVRSWPLVGEWHQQGLGLLLGSFGTLCVLIFGRPEAEAIRVWNLLAGHAIATATVLVLLHALGPGLLSRSLAMAAMLAAMLATDCVHPPGGALVLMAVDSAAIQSMNWWFMLYPSLAITLAVLLPLGAAVNWLKRNVRFDFPAEAVASPSAAAPSTPARGFAVQPPPSPPPTGLRPKLA